jgi:hypothetical protein
MTQVDISHIPGVRFGGEPEAEPLPEEGQLVSETRSGIIGQIAREVPPLGPVFRVSPVVARKLPGSRPYDLLPILIGRREGEREKKKKKEKEEHCKLKIAKCKVQIAKSAAPFTKSQMIELEEPEVFHGIGNYIILTIKF